MAHYEDVMQRILSRGGPASQMAAETGIDMATDPLAFAGGASVVNRPNPMYQSYNPAGAYAEAGRTVPITQPFGGIPEDLHSGGAPAYYKDKPFYEEQIPYFGTDPNLVRGMREGQSPTGFDYSSLPAYGDASVVPRPTIPTEKQIIDSTVTAPEDERDAAFSRIHNMWARNPGGDWNEFEPDWAEGIGVPKEYIDFYMQVPLEAKMFAHENKGDAKIQSDFEEKYGFVLDVDVPLQGGMERSDLLNLRSTGIPTAP